MKELRCRDTGADCDAVIRGVSEEEVMTRASDHSRREHHHDRFSEQESLELRAKIHDVE